MKIYLSMFEVDTEGKKNRDLEPIQDKLINQFSENKTKFIDSRKFTDYPNIINQIDASLFFVALIDRYWFSSTWKMIELYYASGNSPENEGHFINKPKNCFVYNDPNNLKANFLFDLPNVYNFNGSYSDLIVKISEHN